VGRITFRTKEFGEEGYASQKSRLRLLPGGVVRKRVIRIPSSHRGKPERLYVFGCGISHNTTKKGERIKNGKKTDIRRSEGKGGGADVNLRYKGKGENYRPTKETGGDFYALGGGKSTNSEAIYTPQHPARKHLEKKPRGGKSLWL